MTKSDTSENAEQLVDVWNDRKWLVCAAFLWVGVSAIYFLTAPGRIDIIDGAIRFDVTNSLIEHGIPALQHNYFGIEGRWGYRYAFYQLGTSLFSVPFLLAGKWLGSGSLESEQFAFSLTSIPFASATVALVFLIYGRLGLGMKRALRWSLVLAFCSILWPYAGSSFDAALQAFFLTAAMWAVVESRLAEGFIWPTVSAFAFASLINIQEFFAVLPLSIAFPGPVTVKSLTTMLKDKRVRVILAGVLAGVAVVATYNAFRFGNPLNTGRQAVPHPLVGSPLIGIVGFAVSPGKSIFLYSPTYILGLLGLKTLMTSQRQRFAPIVACIAIQVLLVSTLKFWAGEWAWGPRYLVVSLPLVSLGMPYARQLAAHPRVKIALCGAGLAIQLLAISADHQRFYMERSFPPFFWLDEMQMYKHSALFARPSELWSVGRQTDFSQVRALVPGPLPRSMTSTIWGPPSLKDAPQWMRQYLVFLVPRPWPFWSRYLVPEDRPGPTDRLAIAGLLTAIVAFWFVINLANGKGLSAAKDKQMIET